MFLHFTKVATVIYSSMGSMGTIFILEEHFKPYANVFEKCFYFRRTIISRVLTAIHFEWYRHVICSGGSTQSDLVFYGYSVSLKQAFAAMPSFKGIQLIRHTSCIHSDHYSIIKKSSCSHAFFQIYYVFSEGKLQQGDIMVANFATSCGISLTADFYLLEDQSVI